ncbi:MAG: hypothetical protein RLZZ126_1232 [Pseudomonadota bacterium]|jgi:copper chaperone
MTAMTISIDNLKCGGCEATIVKGLSSLTGVDDVKVDHATQSVILDADESRRADVLTKLKSMGYPESGTVRGLDAGLANAKSYVSCAIGRFS